MSAGRYIMDVILTLQQKQLLRVDEAARILNVSRWTVYRWVEGGRLGGTRLGVGSLRIFSNTVAALIDHHCVGVPVVTVMPQGSQALKKPPVQIGRQDSIRSGVRPKQQAAL
jgi:excisionase family DNA binding protein